MLKEALQYILDGMRPETQDLCGRAYVITPSGAQEVIETPIVPATLQLHSLDSIVKMIRTEAIHLADANTPALFVNIPSPTNVTCFSQPDFTQRCVRAVFYSAGATDVPGWDAKVTLPSYDESTQKITMAYATEFTALTSSSGKFTSISLGGFLAGALTKISMSLINNSKFDIVSYVIRKMAEAVSEWLENELINGTDGKIEGVSKVTAAVTAAAATAITADELIDLQESIPDKLQPGCIWVMSRATRTAIRKLKDGEGNYLLNKDATAKWGYSLFGHDVYVSQSMPDMAAGKRAVLYLDPTGLAVKVAENPSVQVLREKFADEHAVGVICWMEVDSKVENKQKIAVLDMKAAVSPGG